MSDMEDYLEGIAYLEMTKEGTRTRDKCVWKPKPTRIFIKLAFLTG